MDPFPRFLGTVVLLACGREDVPACLGPCDSVGRRCDTADQLLVMIHQEAEWEREAYQHTTQPGAPRIPHGACPLPGETAFLETLRYKLQFLAHSFAKRFTRAGVTGGGLLGI